MRKHISSDIICYRILESNLILECHNMLNSLAEVRVLSCSRFPDMTESGETDDIARLGAGQSFMEIEPAVTVEK